MVQMPFTLAAKHTACVQKRKISIKKLWQKGSVLPMNMVQKYMSQPISLLTMQILKVWLTISKKFMNLVLMLY